MFAHCIVSSLVPLVTWWWPSIAAETWSHRLCNKLGYQTVVFWRIFPLHILLVTQRGRRIWGSLKQSNNSHLSHSMTLNRFAFLRRLLWIYTFRIRLRNIERIFPPSSSSPYICHSWATCWPVPVSRIQKSLQRTAMIPSASWGIVFHYPG